jgi:putative membrane protein
MEHGTLQKIVAWCVIMMPFIPGYVMAQGGGGENWHRSPWMMGWFGPFGMLLFWTVLIVAIVLILRGVIGGRKDAHRDTPLETALDLLKKRYASGEITKDEFDAIKKDLES